MITIVILLFCLASFFSFLKFGEKNTKTFLLLLGGLLFLAAAFRVGNTVNDYDAYVIYYKNAFNTNVEFSFIFIAWIVRHIFFDNVLFLFVIYAMLGVALKIKALTTLTTLVFLSVIIYIGNFYILHELTQIRIGVAAGFLLLSIKPLYERNLKKFIFFAGCAMLFHYSALLIFFLWFFKGNSINKYVYAAIIPLAYVLYFFHINLIELFIQLIPIEYIQQRYGTYVLLQKKENNFANINVFNYVFLAKCLIFYVLLWKSKLIEIHNKYVNLLLKIEALSLISFVLFSAMPVFAFRISELFGVVEIILIPFIYYVFKPRFLSKALVIFIGLCMLLINIFYVNLITF
jgi:hypothetical protein